MSDFYAYDDEDEQHVECSWCGGSGLSDCDDPLSCFNPGCDGAVCECGACDGRGYDQRVW